MNKVTFEIKKKEYILPDKLTIDHYMKIYKVKDLLGEQFFQTKIISAITGAKQEDILKSNHTQINFISNYLVSLFPDSKYPFTDKFELNGIEYGFIPSWKNMSFAEFVDLDTLLTKKPEEIIDNLHIICAIMYRPIINKRKEHDFDIQEYDVDTLETRAELFRNELDVKYVLGGNFFFSKFAKQSLEPSQQSLILKSKNFMQKMVLTWKMRKVIWKILLNKPLDGLQLSIDLAKTTLQNINKSYRLPLWKRSINFFTFQKRTKK